MANDNRFEKLVPTDKFFGGDLKVLICYMLSALGEAVPIPETTQLSIMRVLQTILTPRQQFTSLKKRDIFLRAKGQKV